MNATILEPQNLLHLSGGAKVSALHFANGRLYIGFTNGDLSIKSLNTHTEPSRTEPRSIRSFRSFSEARRLFQDNEASQLLSHEKTFGNVTGNSAPISTLCHIPIYNDSNRIVLFIGTTDILRVYEWVGSHLNLVRSFDDMRSFCHPCFAELSEELRGKPQPATVDESPPYVDESDTSSIHKHKMRLCIIGSKKKLLIYKVVQKSRNVFDFVINREILMRERVRSVQVFPKHSKAVIASNHSIYILNLLGEHQVESLTSDTSTVFAVAQSSSFSYFGLSSGSQDVSVVPIDDNRALVIRDAQVGVLELCEHETHLRESVMKLSSPPVHVGFLSPCYAIFVYPKSIDVVEIQCGVTVQSFKHSLSVPSSVCSQAPSVVAMAAGNDIYQFKYVDIQRQLDYFLSLRYNSSKADYDHDLQLAGLERAISLVAALDEQNDFFIDHKEPEFSRSKLKQLYLRDLHKDKAVILFERYSKYNEALADIASEWVISFTEVLLLFPSFLNGSASSHQLENTQDESKYDNIVKRVTVDQLEKNQLPGRMIDSATDTDSKSEKNSADRRIPTSIKQFHKAVHSLIIYLTDQRRIHLSFINNPEGDPSIDWKNVKLSATDLYPGADRSQIKSKLSDFAVAIDTTLFLCYFYSKPMLLGPLLRLPNNRCNAKVVNDCLLKNLDLSTKESSNFISQLLDFYYARSLHEEALKLLKQLALENPDHQGQNRLNLLQGPGLSIQYMQRLSNEHLKLILEYSTWIFEDNDHSDIEEAKSLFMNDSYECESYNNLEVLDYFQNTLRRDDIATTYLEWFFQESDLIDVPSKKRYIPKLVTRLCLLYIKQLKALSVTEEEFRSHTVYRKLYKVFESGADYEPWTILKEIPSDQDRFLKFTVFVYHRLGEHRKSVDVLFNQLGDLDAAADYCSRLYYEPNGQREGSDLLFKLLEDLLMHYNENQESIARLLTLQGDKMSTLQLLTALPDSFPLHKIEAFLSMTISQIDEKVDNSKFKSQLYKIGAAKIQHQLIKAQSTSYTIRSADQCCGQCGNKFGYSVLCVDDHENIVHYGCLKRNMNGSLSK